MRQRSKSIGPEFNMAAKFENTSAVYSYIIENISVSAIFNIIQIRDDIVPNFIKIGPPSRKSAFIQPK